MSLLCTVLTSMCSVGKDIFCDDDAFEPGSLKLMQIGIPQSVDLQVLLLLTHPPSCCWRNICCIQHASSCSRRACQVCHAGRGWLLPASSYCFNLCMGVLRAPRVSQPARRSRSCTAREASAASTVDLLEPLREMRMYFVCFVV